MKEIESMAAAATGQKQTFSQGSMAGPASRPGAAVACGILLLALLGGCASGSGGGPSYGMNGSTGTDGSFGMGGKPDGVVDRAREMDRKLGIRMEGLRLSAAGYMLDFRYRVVDPDKAAVLLDRKVRPYLLDDASGAQLGVPDTAKLGQLRTTGRNKVVRDQDYFILFANPSRFVQAGNRMTLVMGDVRIENLVVE